MKQKIDDVIWQEYKDAIAAGIKIHGSSKIKTGAAPQTDWMREVCSKLKISDVAFEHGIDKCPVCSKYFVNFDDGRGWFCCQDAGCSFHGNIVDFFKFIEEKK